MNIGDSVGTIEAVKTVADIYSPIAGRIAEINSNLEDEPDCVNNDPYDSGWIIKLDSLHEDRSALLSPNEYQKLTIEHCELLKKTINKLPLPKLPEFDSSKVLKIIQKDKKIEKGSLNFILLEEIGRAVVKDNINEQSIINVLEDL